MNKILKQISGELTIDFLHLHHVFAIFGWWKIKKFTRSFEIHLQHFNHLKYQGFPFFFFIQYLSRGIQFSRASLNGALTKHKNKDIKTLKLDN